MIAGNVHKDLSQSLECLAHDPRWPTPLELIQTQGRSEGGSWGAHDPPFVSLFLRKQPTIFRGENAMTIMFDSV